MYNVQQYTLTERKHPSQHTSNSTVTAEIQAIAAQHLQHSR